MRRAFPLVAIVLLAAIPVGCGGDEGGAAIDEEADAVVLNGILARQIAAVDAYDRALPALRGAQLAAAREFRAQEQEHVDATTKALRGLEADADPPAETIEGDGLRTPGDALRFLYEVESATIDAELSAVGKLTIAWPRPLIASMAANQAQRLVLIRRALGARPLATVPEAFETGETPAPEEMIER